MTLSARASTLGEILSILDFRYFDIAQYRFVILDSKLPNFLRFTPYRITLSALVSTFGGIVFILDLDLRFWILDSMSHNCSRFTLTELLCLLVPARWAES